MADKPGAPPAAGRATETRGNGPASAKTPVAAPGTRTGAPVAPEDGIEVVVPEGLKNAAPPDKAAPPGAKGVPGKAAAEHPHAEQKRVAVSAILSEVDDSRDGYRDHILDILKSTAEVLLFLVLYIAAMVLVRMPAPEHADPEEAHGGRSRYVWLQVRPMCWAPPNWTELAAQAQEVAPTARISLQGEGAARFMLVDGLVDSKNAETVRSWGPSVQTACLSVEKGKDDYSLLIKARWTPTDGTQVLKAAEQLATVKAKIRKLIWEPSPVLVIESLDFPAPTMTRDDIRGALEKGGLRDFKVEVASEDVIDDAARAAWRQLAVMPLVLEQRGLLMVQMAAWACLAALLLLIARGRFEGKEEREPMSQVETWTRASVAMALTGIGLLLVFKRLGLPLSPLTAMMPEPDKLSRTLALLGFGLALPVTHTIAMHGYVQRRLSLSFNPRTAGVVTALLFPLVPPLSYHFLLWWPVVAMSAYLVYWTGRLGPGLAIVVMVQAAVAYQAFG